MFQRASPMWALTILLLPAVVTADGVVTASCADVTDATATSLAGRFYLGADQTLWEESNGLTGLQREACLAPMYGGSLLYFADQQIL